MPEENLESLPADNFGLQQCVGETYRTVMNVCVRKILQKKTFYHGLNPAIFTEIATLICSSESFCLTVPFSGD